MTAKTWTGKAEGVRAPMTGETQLSAAEVAQGLKDGAFPTTDARAHLPKPRTPKVRTIGWGDATAGLLAMAEEAGANGITWADIKAAHPEWKPQTISGAVNRHLDAKTMQRRGKGGQIRYFPAWVPAAVCDAVHAEDCERSRLIRVAKRREYSEKHRRAVGDMTREEYRAYQAARTAAAKNEKARQRIEKAAARKLANDARKAEKAAEREAKANAEARAAIRKEKAEARELAKALEATQPKPKSTAGNAMRRATQAINRLAEKHRGTVSPTAIVPKPAKPGPVEIPRHLVQVCKPMTLPHERIQPAGVIPRTIGHYTEKEVSPWVKAMGVAA